MPPDPPGVPARSSQIGASRKGTYRAIRLARGIAAQALRSRASLESDGLVSNSDDSTSFVMMQLPRRQPIFTFNVPAASQQHLSPQMQPVSMVEQQQSQSSGSGTNPPQQYETPTGALRAGNLFDVKPTRRPNRKSNGSNSSFNFDSPKPRQLTKIVSEASQTPQTPQHLNSGINPDGSQSVIRNDDDANNSGLLDLSPVLTRVAKQRMRGGGILAAPTGLRFGSPSHLLKMTLPTRGTSTLAKEPQATAEQAEAGILEDAISDQADASVVKQAHLLPSNHDGDDAQPSLLERIDIDVSEAQGGEQEQEQVEYTAEPSDTLTRLRRWRHDAMQQHLYETAIFWGDKILSLETSAAAYNDAYHLAQCYFYTHQFARAEHLLTNPLRTGASRHVSAKAQPHGNTKKSTGVTGILASEKGEDGDALFDALAATRSQSQLPASILARSSTKGSMHSTSTAGKRKERGFTVSATGTASSSGSARSTNSRAGSETDEDIQDASIVIQPAKRARRQRNQDSNDLNRIEEDLIEVRDKEPTLPDGPSLVNHSLACRYLAAQCQVRLGKYHAALDLIGDKSQWSGSSGNKRPSSDGGIKLGSSVAFLRGQIYLRLEDLPRARESFMMSLALDVKNYEAFSALIDGNMLGVEQQWSFVQGLEYLAQAGDEEGAADDFEFIRLMYTTRLSKQGKSFALNTAAARRRLSSEYGLSNNPDILLGLAEELFARLRFADAFTVTSRILELSADHPTALPIHIASMYHLKSLRPSLFMLAHRLTELDPESPVAWYAVGTWYASSKRWSDARRYYSKASLLDPRFAPSWIAFGHTFAMEGESDQAITAYSTASRLFPQSHLPRLFIGMEHLHQGNLSLARLALEGSAGVWEDPLTENERGVVAYQSNDIPAAIEHFKAALRLAEKSQEPASAWKGVFLNLGLAYRRIDADEQAKGALLKVAELDPHCYQAKLALGMISHRAGHLQDAVAWYHEALSINPRDQYGTDLLDFALEEKTRVGVDSFAEKGKAKLEDPILSPSFQERRLQDQTRVEEPSLSIIQETRIDDPSLQDTRMSLDTSAMDESLSL